MSSQQSQRPKGLDHSWFEPRTLRESVGMRLPTGKSIALLVMVPLEFFPLDAPAQPFRPSGALDRPYPDSWGYANRDYGNRIGIYRLVNACARSGIRPTAFIDAATAKQYPDAMKLMANHGWEFAASGIDRGTLHFGKLDRSDEDAIISDALGAVAAVSPNRITGWQSPGQSESYNTLDLLASNGIQYVADWVNDERPFTITTPNGKLVSMPTSFELSDRNILVNRDFTVTDYVQMVTAAASRLIEEATAESPRVLSLSLSPWVSGYPHRIRAVSDLLAHLMSEAAIWPATCAEVARVYSVSGN